MTFDLHCTMKSETRAKVDEIADIKTQIEGIRKWVTENKAAATIACVSDASLVMCKLRGDSMVLSLMRIVVNIGRIMAR